MTRKMSGFVVTKDDSATWAARYVGAREAKNRFSELAAEASLTGRSLPVLKNGKPWVMIQPASEEARKRRARMEQFRALTARIERGTDEEPGWDSAVSDYAMLAEERLEAFRQIVAAVELTDEVLDRAFSSDEPDLEDGIVRATAELRHAVAIVTRDGKAYAASAIPSMTAREFLQRKL